MNLRPFLVVATVLILVGINGYLLYSEYHWHDQYHGVPPAEAQPRHVTDRNDPLLDIKPISADRAVNLKKFGLPDPMAKKTLDRMRDLDDRWKERLQGLLNEVGDPSALADAFCGQTQQVRPRYGALRFLIEEEQGERRPVRIERISELKRQPWSKTGRIDEVYNVAELDKDHQPDATLMAIAAIVLKREDDLLEGYKPWGRGFAATWSWEDVVKKYPGIEDRLVEYFALMHVTWEMAAGSEGICGE